MLVVSLHVSFSSFASSIISYAPRLAFSLDTINRLINARSIHVLDRRCRAQASEKDFPFCYFSSFLFLVLFHSKKKKRKKKNTKKKKYIRIWQQQWEHNFPSYQRTRDRRLTLITITTLLLLLTQEAPKGDNDRNNRAVLCAYYYEWIQSRIDN